MTSVTHKFKDESTSELPRDGFFPSLHIYKNLPRITVFRKLKCLDAGGSQRMFTKVNSIDKLHTDLAN